MKDIFTSSIRVPKHDVPLIYTEVGINILKNKAEFKGKGDPFKSKNLYNVYFDNFFHPRNFNKTKIKKNINDYILGLEHRLNTYEYFFTTFIKVLNINPNKKMSGEYRKYDSEIRDYKTTKYNLSFKEVVENWNLEKFYNSIKMMTNTLGYNLVDKKVRHDLEERIESLVSNPLIINSFPYLPYDTPKGAAPFKVWEYSRIFWEILYNHRKEWWSRITIPTIKLSEASKLHSIFDENWEMWQDMSPSEIRKSSKDWGVGQDVVLNKNLTPPFIIIDQTVDHYSHMQESSDYYQFTLVLDKIDMKDISRAYTLASGESIKVNLDKSIKYSNDKYIKDINDEEVKLYYVIQLWCNDDESDIEMSFRPLWKPSRLIGASGMAAAASEYMADGGILPHWEDIIPRIRLRIIPLNHGKLFVNWIKNNPLELK